MFAIAARAKPGDFDSWYGAWFQAAESTRALAQDELAAGHEATAGLAHLRAMEYYRLLLLPALLPARHRR